MMEYTRSDYIDLTQHSLTLAIKGNGHPYKKSCSRLALVHIALLPKKLDNHVSLGLTNDCAKFEGASLLREGRNRVLQTRGQS